MWVNDRHTGHRILHSRCLGQMNVGAASEWFYGTVGFIQRNDRGQEDLVNLTVHEVCYYVFFFSPVFRTRPWLLHFTKSRACKGT